MTSPHKLDAPDDSFVVGDGWQWGQNMDPDIVGLLTMGGILPDPNNIFDTMKAWLGNLPLQVLQPLFRPLLPLSTDADWVDTPTAVNTILSALPLQQLQQFWNWVTTVFDPLQKLFDDLLRVLSGVLVNPGGVLQPVADLLGGLVGGLRDLVTGIIGLFGGAGSSVADALKAVSDWLTGVFQPVAAGLAAIGKVIQDLLDGLFGLFGVGGVTGKTPLEVIAAISAWLTGVFKPVADGLAAIVKTVTDLIGGFFKLFGGSGTVSLAGMLIAAGTWMTHWQEFVDGIWTAFTGGVAGVGKTVADAVTALKGWFANFHKLLDALFGAFGGVAGTDKAIADVIGAITGWFANFHKLLDALFGAFGGVAGTDKTIADVIGAITGWFTNVFQKLMDEIAKLWGWTPGAGGAAIHAGITDVIATISGILGIGQSAATSAANANAGLAAIVAGQKGGFFDEFELPIANDLPATDWKKTSTLADSYGTDGNGSAVFNASGTNVGWTDYVQISKPLLVPDMRCGVTLSKLPRWDPLVRSAWRIKVQCNPTDKACFEVQIENTRARFYAVDAFGNGTALGAWQAIPPNAMGPQYELEIKGNVLTLFRGGIQVATYSGATPMSGRCVGFGAKKVAYVGDHPCINLAGVSWRPVT